MSTSQPLISIIVPIHNTESYIDECIKSILTQKFTDFELLLIDDGSTDSSLLRCNEFAAQDKRIRILSQPQSGVSAARNKGIEVAQGEWICFIDSDDQVEPNYLATFIEKGCLRKSCLNQQGWKILTDGICSVDCQYPDKFFTSKKLKIGIRHYKIINNNAPYSKLFNRELLNDIHLRFNTKLSIREDALFVYQYRSAVSEVKLISSNAYLYRKERNRISLSHQIHPYQQFVYLKETLPPVIAHFMDTFSLWEEDYPHKVYCMNKSTIILSGIKALYAHRVQRKERQHTLCELLGNDAYYADSHFQPLGLTKHLRKLYLYIPIPLLDITLYILLKSYYHFIYFQKF